MTLIGVKTLACLMALGAVGCAPVRYETGVRSAGADEVSLRVADTAQAAAVVAGDVPKIRALMHPSYRVNAPTNRVMTGAEILAMFEKGIITAEPLERTIESAVVQGMTGIVMGRENLVPVPGSQLAKSSGGQPILRRFTNIYSFESGRWWFVGRHFNQVAR